MLLTLSPCLVPKDIKYYSIVGSSFLCSDASLICNFSATAVVCSVIYSSVLTVNIAGPFSISVTKLQDNSLGKRCCIPLPGTDLPHLILIDPITPSLPRLSFMAIPIFHLPQFF